MCQDDKERKLKDVVYLTFTNLELQQPLLLEFVQNTDLTPYDPCKCDKIKLKTYISMPTAPN